MKSKEILGGCRDGEIHDRVELHMLPLYICYCALPGIIVGLIVMVIKESVMPLFNWNPDNFSAIRDRAPFSHRL